jgi:hypothetical protein
MTAKAPKVPKTLVELGRLVELGFEAQLWKWLVSEDWILTSSESGKRLYLFERPGLVVSSPSSMDRGKKLYKRFNHRKHDDYRKGKLRSLRAKAKPGRALHIVYNSDKFGPKENYIHHFDHPPVVWVDRNKNPRIVALTGGRIRITSRGIEG